MLCSPEAVKEVLDRQSAVSSSRAAMPVGSEGLSGGLRFLFMEYGPLWRKLRGVAHKLLTPRASEEFVGSQEWEGRMVLREVLRLGEGEGKGTEGVYREVRRYTTSVMMTTTYGRRIPEWVCINFSEVFSCVS